MNPSLHVTAPTGNADGAARGRRFMRKIVEPARDLTGSYVPLLAVIALCIFTATMTWRVSQYVSAIDKRLDLIERKLSAWPLKAVDRVRRNQGKHHGA
jgi:hypothetical protein